ncbi:DsbA family protein [Microvirga sp. W0021]|uniref:DsbA family protein n=1 Tax=Hohaiivirga grylli TaxID=3133970 RepID=A0ABV0BJT3_9HYPH
MIRPFSRLTCAAALLGLTALTPISSLHAANFNDSQRQEIGEIVRDYLMKNPEVLQDVIAELEKKQQEASTKAQASALKESHDTIYNSEHGSVVGNPSGDVTVVEFFDYNCGYCKRAVADLAEMMKADPKLKVVLKDLPVLGQESVEAAQVALAVKQQLTGDKLFKYHLDLMHSKGRVGKQQALDLAQNMGVDMARLQKDMASPEIKAALQENFTLGDKLGLTGTPAFIIADTVIPGAVGRMPLEQMVSNARKCGKASC